MLVCVLPFTPRVLCSTNNVMYDQFGNGPDLSVVYRTGRNFIMSGRSGLISVCTSPPPQVKAHALIVPN